MERARPISTLVLPCDSHVRISVSRCVSVESSAAGSSSTRSKSCSATLPPQMKRSVSFPLSFFITRGSDGEGASDSWQKRDLSLLIQRFNISGRDLRVGGTSKYLAIVHHTSSLSRRTCPERLTTSNLLPFSSTVRLIRSSVCTFR